MLSVWNKKLATHAGIKSHVSPHTIKCDVYHVTKYPGVSPFLLIFVRVWESLGTRLTNIQSFYCILGNECACLKNVSQAHRCKAHLCQLFCMMVSAAHFVLQLSQAKLNMHTKSGWFVTLGSAPMLEHTQ